VAGACGVSTLTSRSLEWVALVPAPDGARFVSLRAKATDRDGNTVQQKTIRAYGIR
jgi:hypothetical protein